MPPVRTGLKSSAQRFTLKNKKVVTKQASKGQAWQTEAWGYFDSIPELKYSVWFLGNVMSKVRLFVGVRPVDDPDADPIPITDPKADVPPALAVRAQAELQRLKGPLGGLPEICREMNMNLEIAAECYLVGIGPHESGDEQDELGQPLIIEEAWDIRSVSEVRVEEGKIKILTSPSDANPHELDPENDTCIRIWQRHPQWSMQADCNMRGVLDECEALVLLINQVKAEAKSRMGGGYFTIPNEVTDAAEGDPSEGEDGEEGPVNPVLLALYEGATDPIEDPSSAAAVAPTFLRGPAEFLKPEYVRHIAIGREASAVLESRIQARVERLARGLNLPVETVLGHQQTTFANAEQVAADQFADHIYPRDVLLVDALTVSFLQPNLLDSGFDQDLVDRVCVWFEPNDQIKQTDLAVTADEGYKLGVLSAEAWRRSKGWTEDDAPEAIERLLRLLNNVRSIDPGITTGIVDLLGEPIEIPEAIPAGTTTTSGPDPTKDTEPNVSIERAILIAAEQRRMGHDVDLQDLFATILMTARENGGEIGDVAKQLHRVLDDLATRPPALPAPARNVGHDLMQIDRHLRARVVVAADKAMTRALERAGNKLRAKSQKHRELVAGTHPRYVAATLGPKLVSSAGFTDAQLIGDNAWDSLRTQYLSWAADAQGRALRIAERLVPIQPSHRATIVQRQADDLASSWDWLADELQKLAQKKLYQPDPTEPAAGESDPTVSIPAGLVRMAIARAGGATGIRTGQKLLAAAKKPVPVAVPHGGDLDVPPDASVFVGVEDGAPLGGIGTGDTVMSVLENGDVGVEAYQWDYGPAFRAFPFEEHETLDGEIFTEFDSDVLAAGDWIGDFYFPGDHDGCNCDIAPIIVEQAAVDDTIDTFGGAE